MPCECHPWVRTRKAPNANGDSHLASELSAARLMIKESDHISTTRSPHASLHSHVPVVCTRSQRAGSQLRAGFRVVHSARYATVCIDDRSAWDYPREGIMNRNRLGSGGGRDRGQGAPQAQAAGCPLPLTAIQRSAGRDALRRSFRAGVERATAVVGNRIVHVQSGRADSVSIAGMRVPAGATLIAHGHLRFIGGS
jgi:hypothetical protein